MDDSTSYDQSQEIKFYNPWAYKYSKTPRAVMYDSDVSRDAFYLYSHILARCGNKVKATLTIKRLMFDTDMKRTVFYASMKNLKEVGLIVCKSRFASNGSRLASDYHLVPPFYVYGLIVDRGWPTRNEIREAKLAVASGEDGINPEDESQTDSIPPHAVSRTPPMLKSELPSTILKEKKVEGEESTPSGSTTTTSIYSQNKSEQPKSALDIKMMFAKSSHKEPKKKVDKPKSKTSDHLGVSVEIRNCHKAYCDQMKIHGMAGGVLTKNKAAVWELFLQGQNSPSDGLKIINHVMSHWKDLKRKYSLSEALPSIYFFKTGYIDPISIDVLSKSTASSGMSSDSFASMAELVKASNEKWMEKADRQDEAKKLKN